MKVTLLNDKEATAFDHEHEVAHKWTRQFYSDVVPSLAAIRTPDREILTVLAHDKQGRILKTEKKFIPAFNGLEHIDYLARREWLRGIKTFAEHDAKWGTRYASYLRKLAGALGGRTGFTARLKALGEARDAKAFWSQARYWHPRS
jgi:hypothetical protein